MTSKELVKERLCGDRAELVRILENLGCHHINPNYGEHEIRCAIPDGVCSSSVSIKLTTSLPCRVFSRPGFEDYEIQDIFALVQYIKNCTFPQALGWLCSQLNIKNDGIVISQDLSILREIKREKIRRNQLRPDMPAHEILDKRILLKYPEIVVKQWVNDGISPDTQRKYGIRDDVYNRRWLIPIYDIDGNLISIKGRTYAPNWETLGIQKYIYYYKLGVSDILFGYCLNKTKIKERDEIILFEAEKSVMAADSYGYGWSCSLGTNHLTTPLFKKILSVPCSRVVMAFDKDVPYGDALKEGRKLSRYKNVWIMYDKKNLLNMKSKDSPTDRGKEIFEDLYQNKIRI